MVGEGLRAGNLGGLRKGSVQERSGIAALDEEISHLQTFGMEVFIFTA
jgi:hypothetical protein